MRIGPKTKLDELLKKYPFLLDYLADLTPKFSKLKNPIMRKTVGRVATLHQVSSFGDVSLGELMRKIQVEVQRVTGEQIEIETGETGGEPVAVPVSSREARFEILKDIIRELHHGGDLGELKKRFAELIRDVSPTEISEMEQRLIEEGMPEEEVKRLCDVHVQVFKEALEEQPPPSSIPGHPLHTFMEENRALGKVLNRWNDLLCVIERKGETGIKENQEELLGVLDDLAPLEKHYLKKENQLFPLLEAKGVSGPSKVMWAIHDDIRAGLRRVRQLVEAGNVKELVSSGQNLSQMISDMIYKEEKILFPMSLATLDEKDWARVKKGEEEIGYAWVEPGKEWQPAVSVEELPPMPEYRRPRGELELDTGTLDAETVNIILKSLPVDLTFVDAEDTVRYYSASEERIFPRSPAIIGRKVQNCHPPASVHVVNRILKAFKEGRRDVAEFWIESRGKFIHIRYFALRDKDGAYRGCLEVSQDVTAIRGLKGEKRLLDWQD